MHPDSDMKIFTPKQPDDRELTRLPGEKAESDAHIPIWQPHAENTGLAAE